MIRNKIATGLAGLALLLLCSPIAVAQATSSMVQPQPSGAKESPVQATKTAVTVGGAAWEVTLSVRGGGVQTITEPVDIVLLLDCSGAMTAQVGEVQQLTQLGQALPSKQAAHAIFAAAQAAKSAKAPRIAAQQSTLTRMAQKARQAAENTRVQAGEAQLDVAEAEAEPQPARTLGSGQQVTPAQRLTRIGVAKRGVQTFLEALAQAGVTARIGVVAYAGTASVLLPLVPDGGTGRNLSDQEASIAALKNTVTNLWQAACDPNDLCYGSGRGANLERGLVAASAMLKHSKASAKYVVVIGGAQPAAVGEAQQSYLVPEIDPAYASEARIAAATRSASQGVQNSRSARVFTVGVGTSGLSGYASPGAGYTASETDVAPALREIAALLAQRVQRPVVTDSAGEGLVIDTDSATWLPTSLGAGAQPYVSVAPDGKTLSWCLGAWLPEGQAATLRYTLRPADGAYGTAGKELALGSATLVYQTPLASGALQSAGISFVPPTVRYTTGQLRVYSSGLPAQLGGTAQIVGPTPVTQTAYFQIEKPAEHAGWRIESVVVNGIQTTPAQFFAETNYRVPVQEGTTVIEYRYVPAPVPAEQWSYTIQYYRDGLLLSQCSAVGSVPAAAPVIQAAPPTPDALAGCMENPVRTWPYSLKGSDEVLRVDYLTVPRVGAQVAVHHVYTDDNKSLVGTHTTAPAADADSYNVRDLFAPGYGGKVYMPVHATLTVSAVDGTQAQQQSILIGDSFSCAAQEQGTLEIRYVPLIPDQLVPPPTSAVEATAP